MTGRGTASRSCRLRPIECPAPRRQRVLGDAEQVGGDVEAGHATTTAGGRYRGVAGPGGDIQHVRAAHADLVDELRADTRKEVTPARVVTRRPHGPGLFTTIHRAP